MKREEIFFKHTQLITKLHHDPLIKGKLSSHSLVHRRCVSGFVLIPWLTMVLLVIIRSVAEVSLPPFIPPETQIKFYFTEASFNLAVGDFSNNMSSYGVKLKGANDSFKTYSVEKFSVSPVVLNLFDIAIVDQESSTYNYFGGIKNISLGTSAKNVVELSFSSLADANVDLVFNKFFTYGFGGYFTYDLSDFFIFVNGALEPTVVPNTKPGVPAFIGLVSSTSRIESLRFQTSDRKKIGGFTMADVYLVFSETEIGQPISVYYDFDSWIAAAQDLPAFRLLEEEDFESFDPSGFNSSTIHFNMFSVEINNPNITAGSISMGVGNYDTNLIIGDLAQDSDSISNQQLALVLDSIENPSVSFIFKEMIIGFGGLFFYAFSDAGILFRVNGQNIMFAAENKDATFLGVVIPSGTNQIEIIVPPGNNSSQTFILDNVWITPHCCMAAKCTVEGIEITSGMEVGEVPLKCLDDNSYLAHIDMCGDGGVVGYKNDRRLFCPDYAPKCQQCGAMRRGGAICIAENAKLSNCSFPVGYNDTGCLVGENNYAVPVGYQITPSVFEQCSDYNNYFSSSSVCGLNLYPEISVTKIQCPKENPICYDSGCCPASGCSALSSDGSTATKIQLLPVNGSISQSSVNLVRFDVANFIKEKRCISRTETGEHSDFCYEFYSMDLSKSSNLIFLFEAPFHFYLVPSAINTPVQFKFSANIVTGWTSENKVEVECKVQQAFNITGGNLTANIFGENCDMLFLSPSSFTSISNCGIDAVIEFLGFSNHSSDSTRLHRNRFLSSNTSTTALISKVVVTAMYDLSMVVTGNQLLQDSQLNGVTGVKLVSYDNLSSDGNLSLAPLKINNSVVSFVLNPAGVDFESASDFYVDGAKLFQVVSPITEEIKCTPTVSSNMESQGKFCSGVLSFSLDDSSWVTFTFAAGNDQEMVLEGTVEDSLIFQFRATSKIDPSGNQTISCTEGVQKINGSEISIATFGSSSSTASFSPTESSIVISACELSIIAKFDVSSGAKVIVEKISASASYDPSLAPKGVQSFWYSTADKMDIRTSSFSLIQQQDQKLPLCCTKYSMPSSVHFLRRIPRFGYSTNVNNLLSGISHQLNDYVIGLIIFPSIILGILLIWLILLLVLKLLGRNRVGMLSGFNTEKMPYQIDYLKERTRRSMFIARVIFVVFVLSALLIYAFVTTLLVLGVSNIHGTVTSLQGAVTDLKLVTTDVKKPLSKLNNTATSLQLILPQMSAFCSSDPPTAIEATKLSIALTNEEMLGSLEKNAELIESSIDFFENKLGSAGMYLNLVNEKMIFLALYVALLVICNCLMIGSATLTWFGIKNHTWFCFHHYVVIPAFILIICISWCFACALLAGCLLNSDLCSGGAVNSPYGTLNETMAFLGLDYYQLLAYYASCNESHPAGASWAQYENYVSMAISAGRSLTMKLQSRNFTQLCSTTDQEMAKSFVVLFNDLETVLSFISSAASLISCKQISPIYNKAINQELCTSSVTGLMWMMWSLLVISVCGMMMITFRAVAIPPFADVGGDSIVTGSGQDNFLANKESANFVGQEICINSSELFENLSVESDLLSEYFPHRSEERSSHRTLHSITEVSNPDDDEGSSWRSNKSNTEMLRNGNGSQSRIPQNAQSIRTQKSSSYKRLR